MTKTSRTQRIGSIALCSLLVAALALNGEVAEAQENSTGSTIKELSRAFYDDDFVAYGEILAAGILEPSVFGQNPDAYDVLCSATDERRIDYLEPLLDAGVSPSTIDPDRVPVTFNPLACAALAYNDEAFRILIDAGAETELVVCPDCPTDTSRPLVVQVLASPNMFDMIVERRELSAFELERVANSVTRTYIHRTHKGKPVNEYYADYLRARGYEVTPAERGG